mmetsp:Transcript_8438/g.22218  ORF Transcript_8438/g.22218 Transcript_8438/m.22218 type:complete len:608 (-) Transcript_8438:1-1824(-)
MGSAAGTGKTSALAQLAPFSASSSTAASSSATATVMMKEALVVSSAEGVAMLEVPTRGWWTGGAGGVRRGARASVAAKARGGVAAVAARMGPAGVCIVVVGAARGGELTLYSAVSAVSTAPAKFATAYDNSGAVLQGAPIVFNKDGVISAARVIRLAWTSLFRFVAVFADGLIVTFDTRLKPTAPISPSASLASDPAASASSSTPTSATLLHNARSDSAHSAAADCAPGAHVAAQPLSEDVVAWRAPKNRKANPVAALRLLNNSIQTATTHSINTAPPTLQAQQQQHQQQQQHHQQQQQQQQTAAVDAHNAANTALTVTAADVFSGELCSATPKTATSSTPTSTSMAAVATRDGLLRVLRLGTGEVLCAMRSSYGAFLSVRFSADGRLVAAGGEDDTVCVLDARAGVALARCEAHASWISALAFAPPQLNADAPAGVYRLASAGQDCRVCLWDIDADAMLRHASNELAASASRSASHSANGGLGLSGKSLSSVSTSSSKSRGTLLIRGKALARKEQQRASGIGNGGFSASGGGGGGGAGGVMRASEAPVLAPLVVHYAHVEPLTDVAWTADGALVSADCAGIVRWWSPAPAPPPFQLVPKGVVASSS